MVICNIRFVQCNLLVCMVLVEEGVNNNKASMLRIYLLIEEGYFLLFTNILIPSQKRRKHNVIAGICNQMTVPCYQLVCMVIVDDVTYHFIINTLITFFIEYIGIPSYILHKSHIYTNQDDNGLA
jgi:hypothetical protein